MVTLTLKKVEFDNADLLVKKWSNGDLEIKVYNIPKKKLKQLSIITGKTIIQSGSTYWIRFTPKDNLNMTIFED